MKILILSVLSLALFSCAKVDRVLDKAENIPTQLDATNTNMLELKRLTILGEMKKEADDKKNYEILSPVPYDLMAPCKKLGENFTADEVIQWAYTMISKINNARYDDNFGKPVDASNPEAIDFEHSKLGVFNAVSAVAAFLPEAVVDQLISKVYTSEEYSTTVLNVLAMRVYFIQKVMLKEKYAPSKLTDIGTVEAAIGYNQSVEKILKLSFAQYVRSDISGFNLMTDLNTELSFDLSVADAKTNWKNIARGMDTYLKVTQFSADAQAARVNAARATVNAGIKAYEAAQTAPAPAVP